MVSPHKWVGNAGIAMDIMTVTQHIVTQYVDINLSTLSKSKSKSQKFYLQSVHCKTNNISTIRSLVTDFQIYKIDR